MTRLEDPTSANVLASPNGPLDCSCPESPCDECEGAVSPGRSFVVNGEILCDTCALAAASRVLDTLPAQDSDEEEARDVIRQFAREILAGEWTRRST